MSTELQQALSRGDSEEIRYALSAFLKKDVRASSQVLRPEPINSQCGTTVDAQTCKSILSNCLENSNMNKCIDNLESIKNNLSNGFTGMNSTLALDVCKTLGINLNVPNPKEEWISRIEVADAAAAKKIAVNQTLQNIIHNFIVAAQNPLVDSKSYEFTQRRIQLSSTIRPRTPRGLITRQTGGGDSETYIFNRYIQYADSLKSIVSMTGGGAQPILNETYDELANIYNNFVNHLKAQGKQVEDSDNERIRQLLSELKYTEEKLRKVVIYIARYNEVRNNPVFKDELNRNPVTATLLEDLTKKYETLQAKQKKKVYNFLSISDVLNKAVNLEDKVDEILERIGPKGSSAPSAPSSGSPSSGSLVPVARSSSLFGSSPAVPSRGPSPAVPSTPSAPPSRGPSPAGPSTSDILASQRARADAEAAKQAELARQLAAGVPRVGAEAIAQDVYNKVLSKKGPNAATPSAAGLFGDMSTVKKYFNY